MRTSMEKAKNERTGIAWWNACSKVQRSTMLESPAVLKKTHASGTLAGSAARCYSVFQNNLEKDEHA